MYIHSSYSLIEKNNDAKEYKRRLKEISAIKLRRSSKFNVLAILGALKSLENKKYAEDLSLYISSENACVSDMLKVLHQVNNKDEIVMPFDFLNVNTNNIGFYISQALNINGNNINISCKNFSFEKALETALFDLEIRKCNEVLVGCVDESIEGLFNNSTLQNENQYFDKSSWIYITNLKKDSIAKVEKITYYSSLSSLNDALLTLNYKNILLNTYAKQEIGNLIIDDKALINYLTKDITNYFDFKDSLLYLNMDSNNCCYLILFTK